MYLTSGEKKDKERMTQDRLTYCSQRRLVNVGWMPTTFTSSSKYCCTHISGLHNYLTFTLYIVSTLPL